MVFVLCMVAHAAYGTPFWQGNFGLPAINGYVNAIAETPDAFYYGGGFTSVGSVKANNIVRVDKSTGTVTALGTPTQNGTAGTVNALAVIGTDLYVGGSFIGFSDDSKNNTRVFAIAKWDTQTGTWSFLGSPTQNGVSDGVNALAANGTDLYVGGSFSTVSSSTQNKVSAAGIAKWDTTTGVWSPLGSATQNGTGTGGVKALLVSGTGLYAGGNFATVSSGSQNGAPAKNIARWDFSTATWSPLGSSTQNGVSSTVYSLAAMGTDLFVGGFFNTASSNAQNAISTRNIAKWDTTTNSWSPLGSASQNGLGSIVRALAVYGTDLYVGGTISQVSSSTQNAISVNGIAKWDTVEATWALLGTSQQNGLITAGGGIGTVDALAISDSSLYVGGSFLSASGTDMTSGIARWNVVGSTWNPTVAATGGDGIAGYVNATFDAGDVVYVGGAFTYVGNVAANNVACWNKSTHTWSALGSATQNGTNDTVYALTMIGSTLYVGGGFTTVSSSTQNTIAAAKIARWDTSGAAWSPFGSATQNGANFAVYAFASIGTDLYVGGAFSAVSSATQSSFSAKSIAKWDTVASAWSRLGSATQNGTNAFVYALAAANADLYVGGNFATVSSSAQNAISAKGIAKWSTIDGTWSLLGSATQNGTPGTVGALAWNGTSLYVGGSFSTVSSSTQNAISANSIARWDIAGSTWSPFGSATQNGVSSTWSGSGTNIVNVLMLNGTDLFVGGNFSTISSSSQNAITANCIAKWDTIGNAWASFGNPALFGSLGYVRALSLSGTDLYLAGGFYIAGFNSSGNISSSGIAVYGLEPVISVKLGGNPLDIFNIFFGSNKVGVAGTPAIFTLTNSGSADLLLGSFNKDGNNPGDFSISAPTSTTVPPGGSANFTITFIPSAEGLSTAALHVATNATGAANPLNFGLQGFGDSTPPAGGTMTLTPASPVNASAPLHIGFANWNDTTTVTLNYDVQVDDVVVSAKTFTSSRDITGPASPGVHTLKGRIYDAAGNFGEATQVFTVSTAQETWRKQFYGTTANTGSAADNADPYGTGIPNLLVFAFFGPSQDPAKATLTLLPQAQSNGGQFTISFVQPSGVTGVTYGAESSLNLAPESWSPIPDTGTGSQHIFSIPVGGNAQSFLRLKVTNP